VVNWIDNWRILVLSVRHFKNITNAESVIDPTGRQQARRFFHHGIGEGYDVISSMQIKPQLEINARIPNVANRI
jgi:hypothetical protein